MEVKNKIHPAILSEPIRFWSKVENLHNENLCWNWMGSKMTAGYGIISIKGKNYPTHRVGYFLFNKVDPEELHVLHKCDNRTCVNPLHLFLGTNADNVNDKVKKGRQGRPTGKRMDRGGIRRGENNNKTKLTHNKVIEIRTLYAAGGVSQYELADKFKVTQAAINSVILKKVWFHI